MRLVYAAVLLAVAGCSAAAPAAAPTASESTGASLSAAAKLACGEEAKDDIAKALGRDTSQPLLTETGTTTVSCTYLYDDGSFEVTVVDQADRKAAAAAYDQVHGIDRRIGPVTELPGIGDAAYASDIALNFRRGSQDVMITLDKLPAKFGAPARSPRDTAILVATTILHCWIDGGV